MTEREAVERLRRMPSEERGRFGEAFWKKVFVASGLRYISLADIREGGAPLARGKDSIVLPDFDVSGEGECAYIDSKVKGGPVLWRKTGEWRHGIDAKNYRQYQEMGWTNRKLAGLAIIELFSDERMQDEWSGRLLIESFLNLSKPIAGTSNQHHMVYWPAKRFSDIDSLGADELFAVCGGRMNRAYKTELLQVFMQRFECPAGKHDWQEVQKDHGIAMECSRCGKFQGYVESKNASPGQRELFT